MKTGIGNLQVQVNEIGKSQEFISSQYESHRAMHTTITKKYVCIEKEQESLNIKIQKMEKEIQMEKMQELQWKLMAEK